MTGGTIIRGGDMCLALAGGYQTVVTTLAGASDLGMIHS